MELFLVFGILVVALIIAGVVGEAFEASDKRKVEQLRSSGKRIFAPVTGIKSYEHSIYIQDPNSNMTRRQPTGWGYRIIAHYRDPSSNQLYTYKSKEFSGRYSLESLQRRYPQGSRVLVLIDPTNPNRYHMETDL